MIRFFSVCMNEVHIAFHLDTCYTHLIITFPQLNILVHCGAQTRFAIVLLSISVIDSELILVLSIYLKIVSTDVIDHYQIFNRTNHFFLKVVVYISWCYLFDRELVMIYVVGKMAI